MSTPSDGSHAADAPGDGATTGGATRPAGRPAQQAGAQQATAHPDRLSVEHGTGTPSMSRKSVVQREKDAFGGVKVGSAFFGWLTATGTAVLLTALLTATGTAVGLSSTGDDATEAVGSLAQQAQGNAGTIGLLGAIALLAVLLVSYFCGGYVAGRMARFNGAKQGVAVWVWAVVVALVVAAVAAIAGDSYDVLGQLDSFPRVPADLGSLTAAGVLALIGAFVVALVGAVLGGLAGMRFHRRVDKAGLGR
ncbi:hypothetical protein [Kineococcus sp. SYSU DK005]|uniref:hypothetical protein n=1 Tax=Kineococcus sp. SYSU DK005 TaxID=3383126 RepID=UPI003D7D3D3F